MTDDKRRELENRLVRYDHKGRTTIVYLKDMLSEAGYVLVPVRDPSAPSCEFSGFQIDFIFHCGKKNGRADQRRKDAAIVRSLKSEAAGSLGHNAKLEQAAQAIEAD